MPRDTINFDAYDERHSPREEETGFDRVVAARLSRRGFLGGAVTLGLGTFLVGTSALTRPSAAQGAERFGWTPIEANTLDAVTIPEGYEQRILVQWGEPLFAGDEGWERVEDNTPEKQARAFGDNNDGMYLFTRDGRTVFAVNNEYTNTNIIWPLGEGEAPTEAQIRTGMMAHGVSIFEIADSGNGWEVVKDSDLNRRITPETEMEITGPAAGHDLLKTAADETGTRTLGTWNNCGAGATPWGTYLTCEENFNGYFSSSDEAAAQPEGFSRYGINAEDAGYGWARIDERFDWSVHPNEANRAGYVVEIDPFDPTFVPKKRTALGRFKHENAEVVLADDGRVVVYLGDDERGEFLYKFVSNGTWTEGGETEGLLDDGQLHVATFAEDGTGAWVALTPEATGMDAATIAIHTRQAASAVGATTMDRPEWVAAHPSKAEAYCALTNNANRGIKPNAGGDETPVGGPNPRPANNYGQIVRWWYPEGGSHADIAFQWDLFLLAGNPVAAAAEAEAGDTETAEAADQELATSTVYQGSENINAGNMFNSPDCIAFDSKGLLWILTDGNYSNEADFAGHGNNQMLAGDTETGEVRRFLVGPREAEVTGVEWSPDRRTMFVGIQHPGEEGGSSWPTGGVPRSAIVAITRTDGAEIG